MRQLILVGLMYSLNLVLVSCEQTKPTETTTISEINDYEPCHFKMLLAWNEDNIPNSSYTDIILETIMSSSNIFNKEPRLSYVEYSQSRPHYIYLGTARPCNNESYRDSVKYSDLFGKMIIVTKLPISHVNAPIVITKEESENIYLKK